MKSSSERNCVFRSNRINWQVCQNTWIDNRLYYQINNMSHVAWKLKISDVHVKLTMPDANCFSYVDFLLLLLPRSEWMILKSINCTLRRCFCIILEVEILEMLCVRDNVSRTACGVWRPNTTEIESAFAKLFVPEKRRNNFNLQHVINLARSSVSQQHVNLSRTCIWRRHMICKTAYLISVA
jgi:hypothetical protein